MAAPVSLSLVCFSHVDGDDATKALQEALNSTGEVLLTHTVLDDKHVLRLSVGGTWTTSTHVERVSELIDEILG